MNWPRGRAGGRGGLCSDRVFGTLGGAGALEGRRIRFNGPGFSLKGEKDRFVLPAEFRRPVRDSGEGERILCIQAHPDLDCLIAFGLSREGEFDEQLDREEAHALARNEPFNRQLRASQLFGFTKVPFDESGRFLLPARFARAANIDDRLFFQGAGPEILIFAPNELRKLGPEYKHMKLDCDDLEEKALEAAAAKGRKP